MYGRLDMVAAQIFLGELGRAKTQALEVIPSTVGERNRK
jgi:hypothetical protein